MNSILLVMVLALVFWNIIQSIRIDKLEANMKSSDRELFNINKYLIRNDEY
jgi:uncharacterized membrane protein YwzB